MEAIEEKSKAETIELAESQEQTIAKTQLLEYAVSLRAKDLTLLMRKLIAADPSHG